MNSFITIHAHPAEPSVARGPLVFIRIMLVVVSLLMPLAVQAVTLPYTNGFNYANGVFLGVVGSGTETDWSIGNSPNSSSPAVTNTATLTYSGLPDLGGLGVLLDYPGTSAKERGVDTASFAMTGAGETLYASFLLNVQSYPASNCPVAYYDDNGSPSGSFQGIGMLPDGRLTLHRNAAVTAPGGTNASALNLSTTYLVVFRYKSVSGSGNDELALWVNPTLGQPSETTPNLTMAVGGSDRSALRGFLWKQDVSFSAALHVDELRLGTNWTDVTPSAICSPAGFSSGPVNVTNSVGGTANFSCVATGSLPSLQWQVSTDSGATWNNVSTGTGGTSSSYTTAALSNGDNGNLYQCVAYVSCDNSYATSAVAQVTVVDVTGKLFRSITSGNWSSPSTWEMSSDGFSWNPAGAPPTAVSSNIVIVSPHTVTVANAAGGDQMTVNAGAKLSIAGGNFTLNDGSETYDLDVAGTLEVVSGSGTNAFGTAGVRFQSGGTFNWDRAAAPAIPTATWEDGSTTRISRTAASDVYATGVSGQSYYDLVFDTTAAGQTARCRLSIQGTATTVRRNFSINIPDTANASVVLNNETNGILTVGNNVTFVAGTTANTTKVLLNNAATNSYVFKVGGNFSASGYFDGFNNAATVFEFTGSGSNSLTLPASAFFLQKQTVSFLVNNTKTIGLGSQIDGFNSFTNKGTIAFGANIIAGGATLAFDPACTIRANGTNQIVSGVTSVQLGGTLDLGSLPAFTGGESFTLFGATGYSGSIGSIVPATPGGTNTWVTTQLDSAGILAVSGGVVVGPDTTPTNLVSSVSGSTLTLTWPNSHIGWTLQTQTNSLSVGLTMPTNTWYDVIGSAATNQVDITINKEDPTVFFRLFYQIP